MNDVPHETEDPRLSIQNIFNSYLCYSIMQESAKVSVHFIHYYSMHIYIASFVKLIN